VNTVLEAVQRFRTMVESLRRSPKPAKPKAWKKRRVKKAASLWRRLEEGLKTRGSAPAPTFILLSHLILFWLVVFFVRVDYRRRLGEELGRWSVFRDALLQDEREAFDRLVEGSLRYVSGAHAYYERDVFDLFVMSSLLSHEERLRMLEKHSI
ncbi:MAG: hypothetical protein QW756_06715, partial [Nitrososphaerota archaeon]